MTRRAFVGFFGLNRSARWTAASIRRNVVTPLRNAGFELFLAGHFNIPDVVDSAWSGESGVKLRNDTALLGLDLEVCEPQVEANIADMLPTVLSVPWYGRADQDGTIRRNLLHQLHSLRRLDHILDRLDRTFELYAVLRPDLEYLDRLKVEELEPILADKADLLTPDWEEWDGLNDRFAFCNGRASKVLMGRWQQAESFCHLHGYIQSEPLLSEAVQAAGLRVIKTNMRAVRVRSTGRAPIESFPMSSFQRTWLRARGRLRGIAAR